MPKALLLGHPGTVGKSQQAYNTILIQNVPGAFDQDPGFDIEGVPKGIGGCPHVFPPCTPRGKFSIFAARRQC